MMHELYQDLILDHNRNPKNYYEMDKPSLLATGYNPLCGDKVTIYLKLKEGKIEQASFVGQGCAISTASASLLTESVIGKSLEEAKDFFHMIHQLFTQPEYTNPELGKLLALSGVKAYPARVKCATLSWHTLESALSKTADITTTE